MSDLTSTTHVECLRVVGVEQLLGVPKLASETCNTQATAIVMCLEEWGVIDQVVVLSFDTTVSNTGPCSGTCTIIELKLGRDLLFWMSSSYNGVSGCYCI